MCKLWEGGATSTGEGEAQTMRSPELGLFLQGSPFLGVFDAREKCSHEDTMPPGAGRPLQWELQAGRGNCSDAGGHHVLGTLFSCLQMALCRFWKACPASRFEHLCFFCLECPFNELVH